MKRVTDLFCFSLGVMKKMLSAMHIQLGRCLVDTVLFKLHVVPLVYAIHINLIHIA